LASSSAIGCSNSRNVVFIQPPMNADERRSQEFSGLPGSEVTFPEFYPSTSLLLRHGQS
jgi:hypothetical protein